MSNYQLILKFIGAESLFGYFDKKIVLSSAIIYLSSSTSIVYNNIALVNSLITADDLKQIENTFNQYNKVPLIAFENTSSLNDLKDFIKQHGYQQEYENSWMFHEGKNIDKSRFNEVRKVRNLEELEIFINIFDRSYQKDDPQNPYGEVKEYLNDSRNTWEKYHNSNKFEYFIGFNKNQPVAVSVLTNYEDMGYISSVGSLPEVRGQGYGKLVTLYAVQQSVNNGNIYHCLGTEEGHYPHRFYQRLGFSTKFTNVGFKKHTN